MLLPPEQGGGGNRTAPYSKDHPVANGMGTIRHKPAVCKHITGATPNATSHAGCLTTWTPSAEQAEQAPPHCLSPIANNPIANVRPVAHPSITLPAPLSVVYDVPRAPPKIRLPPAAKTPPPYTKTGPTPRPRTSTMVPGVEKVQVRESESKNFPSTNGYCTGSKVDLSETINRFSTNKRTHSWVVPCSKGRSVETRTKSSK